VKRTARQLLDADAVHGRQRTMQVPPVTTSVRRVGRCKSASAADVQFHSRWHSRNCRHERVPVTVSWSENAASERSQKSATGLSSATDADAVTCRRRQYNADVQGCSRVPCITLTGTVSPHGVVSPFHTGCHCVACCSCSPFDRRSGNCPAFTFPAGRLSDRRAQSLDSGLALCGSCAQRLSAVKDSNYADVADSVQNSVESDAIIHKSSSVPACCSSQMRYYAAGISFDSLNDDACQTYNPGVDSASSNSISVCTDATVVTTQHLESPIEKQMSPAMDYMHNEVSPMDYHKRFEVFNCICLHLMFQNEHLFAYVHF